MLFLRTLYITGQHEGMIIGISGAVVVILLVMFVFYRFVFDAFLCIK